MAINSTVQLEAVYMLHMMKKPENCMACLQDKRTGHTCVFGWKSLQTADEKVFYIKFDC